MYIASKRGRVLGYELSTGFDCDIIQEEIVREKKDFLKSIMINYY